MKIGSFPCFWGPWGHPKFPHKLRRLLQTVVFPGYRPTDFEKLSTVRMIYLMSNSSSGKGPRVSMDNSWRGVTLFKWWSTKFSQSAGLCHLTSFGKWYIQIYISSGRLSSQRSYVHGAWELHMYDPPQDAPQIMHFLKTAFFSWNLTDSSSWALRATISSPCSSLTRISSSTSSSSVRKMRWVEAIPDLLRQLFVVELEYSF